MTDDPTEGTVASIHDCVVTHVTSFVRDLRRAGVDVPATASIEATRALAVVGFEDFWRARAATRATLLTRPEDVETFDRLFPHFWETLTVTLEASDTRGPADEPDETAGVDDDRSEAPDREDADAVDSGDHTDDGSDTSDDDWGGDSESPDVGGPQVAVETGESARHHRSVSDDAEGGEVGDQVESSVYSQFGTREPVEVVGFSDSTALMDAIKDLTRSLAERRGHRWTPSASGGTIDTRRALRRSVSTGGIVVEVPRKDRGISEVQGVVLVDVSRSVLDSIDRGFLVQFLRTIHDSWRDVRIFFFDTHVREVSEQFDAPSGAAALEALQRAETEWGGGTRIGHALASLRSDHPHAIDRTTTVFVISDGLEVGDVDLLEAEMAELSRRAKRVLWLNPLAAASNYEPTCRGMAVSLRYVDGLFAFAGPDDIAEMARQLRLRGAGGAVGYEYDARP
jgi:uncharacterized protein with von Willebrand factor type A (vWA) domain